MAIERRKTSFRGTLADKGSNGYGEGYQAFRDDPSRSGQPMSASSNAEVPGLLKKSLEGATNDPRRWRSFLWLIYGGAALVTIAIYFGQGDLTRTVIYDLFGLTASAMIVIGVWVNRPAHSLPWLLIALGQFFLVSGDITWAWYENVAHIATPFPSPADALYLMGYPVMAAGILLFVHHRSEGKDRNGLLDATCITLSLGILAWIFLMEPYASDPALTGLEKAISIAYPLGNIAILAVLIRLVLSTSLRSAPLRMLIGAFILQLIADSIYGAQLLLTGTYGQGFSDYLTNGFWLGMYALLAMAALHPSMRAVTKRAKTSSNRTSSNRPNRVRVGILASCLLLMPVAQTIQAARGLDMNAPVPVAGSVILVLLIFARMSGLMSDIEAKVRNLTRQDQELRGLLTDRELLTEKLHHQAFHDSLTGVANRLLFADRMDHARAAAKRDKSPLSLLVIDLDDFKSVNDEFGHAAGDALLVTVAGRLTQSVRPGDTVGRIGGDEFGILLVGASEKEAAIVSERLLRDLRLPLPIGDQLVSIEASVGVVCRVDETESEELLGSADLAMYEAKKRGKGRYELFDPILQTNLVERQDVGRAFEKALAEGELKVHYQPIIGLADGKLIGTEALLRWVDPLRGNIPPSEFLPLAQAMNLMPKVDSFVLRTAVAQLSKWLLTTSSGFQMNVNISASKLIQPGFVEEISDILKRFDAPPSSLVLEITETDLLVDTGRAATVLGRLKATGVKLALDDFGTGYSSLSHVRCFPIDILKIDKSFIDDLGRSDGDGKKQIMASVINSMGRSFGMVTVAEGIESVEQVNLLRRFKCRVGQGYLFARPAPPEELEDLIERGRLDIPVLSLTPLPSPTKDIALVAGLLK